MTLEGIQQGAKQLVDLLYSYETKKEKTTAEAAKKIIVNLRKLIKEEQHAGH